MKRAWIGAAAAASLTVAATGLAAAQEMKPGQSQSQQMEKTHRGEAQGENRQGEMQNRQNEQIGQNAQGASGQSTTHVDPQNVHVTGNTHLSNERASRIADALFATATPQPNVNLDINVSVGAPAPGNLELRPLPPAVVDLVPEYHDYEYVALNDEIVVVQPSTRHVVEVISAGGEHAMDGGGATQAVAGSRVNPCGP